MEYLYEIHLHTTGASKCAVSGGKDYIQAYIDKGYTGIIVTDHFYNGHCSISRNHSWKEWVDHYCRGYEEAKEEGDKRGLDVFFGWEETFDGCDDYIIYGLDKKWLYAHPECQKWTRGEQYSAVKKAGGCVVQAHPFRQRYYIQRVVLSSGCVDGVEAVNGGHEDFSFDSLAYRYAQKIGKTAVSGTDIHDAGQAVRGETYGVYLNKKLNSIDDFVKAVCNNDIAGLKAEPGRLDFYGNEKVTLPVEIRDRNDLVISTNWRNYI